VDHVEHTKKFKQRLLLKKTPSSLLQKKSATSDWCQQRSCMFPYIAWCPQIPHRLLKSPQACLEWPVMGLDRPQPLTRGPCCPFTVFQDAKQHQCHTISAILRSSQTEQSRIHSAQESSRRWRDNYAVDTNPVSQNAPKTSICEKVIDQYVRQGANRRRQQPSKPYRYPKKTTSKPLQLGEIAARNA